MKYPEELKYSAEHEWIRTEGENAYIGITAFAQGELGEIVYVDVTTEGEDIGQNDIFGSIEAVKTVSDLFMPVSGKIVKVNTALEDQPELVNSDPYGEGWIIKIHVKDVTQLDGLMSADAYKKLIGQ